MKPRSRIVILILSLIAFIAFVYFFQSIIVYFLLAAIVSFMGRPIMKALQRLQIRQFRLPNSLCALLSLLGVYFVITLLFIIIIPIVGGQAEALTEIEINEKLIRERFSEPVAELRGFLTRYQLLPDGQSLENYLTQELTALTENIQFSSFFGAIGSFIGNFFVGLFAISFIGFFLLKESRLLYNIILTLTPSGYERSVARVLIKIRPLLTRYFIGLLIEVLLVGSLISLGLALLGVENAFFIGMFAGTLNVIPYIGPIIGAILGLILTMLGSINTGVDFYSEMLPMLLQVLTVFGIVQLVDNLVFQPLIYSSSVRAHPLEIFLVILMAGTLAGVGGMVLAIPFYTIFRALAQEFLSEFKIIQSITKGI